MLLFITFNAQYFQCSENIQNSLNDIKDEPYGPFPKVNPYIDIQITKIYL